jgi:hypothetical protein
MSKLVQIVVSDVAGVHVRRKGKDSEILQCRMIYGLDEDGVVWRRAEEEKDDIDWAKLTSFPKTYA